MDNYKFQKEKLDWHYQYVFYCSYRLYLKAFDQKQKSFISFGFLFEIKFNLHKQ